MAQATLDTLFAKMNFKPNKNQKRAIEHGDGPLFLVAGPGSGKTRVLLWRAVNLIVFHGVKPEEIFLSTFTEKAALQLRQGLLALLAVASSETGLPYDISQMYVGTMHSLCHKLISDKRINRRTGSGRKAPVLLDELDQYFFLYDEFWRTAGKHIGVSNINAYINGYIANKTTSSKHEAVRNCQSLFNRFSEECLTASAMREKAEEDEMTVMADLYDYYLEILKSGPRPRADLALIQQEGYRVLTENPDAKCVFKHIIVDEYQDTNAIQEKIYFELAGHKNICVVGDDDQALYRFRGATVENFVFFPDRCRSNVKGAKLTKIPLGTNYRSRSGIVELYSDFIEKEDWRHETKKGKYYRINDKGITAHRTDGKIAVVATSQGRSEAVCDEIAELVYGLIREKKVADPNQIAFLYPSLKNCAHVPRMIDALARRGLSVYAPRANKFLDNEEPTAMIGMFIKVFGCPERNPQYDYGSNRELFDWFDRCEALADEIIKTDRKLKSFTKDKQLELERVAGDYQYIENEIIRHGWNMEDNFNIHLHRPAFMKIKVLSKEAKRDISGKRLEAVIKRRGEQGRAVTLKWFVNRVTSLDWSILDLFYELCGFDYFRNMFDLAESRDDEGPICNLALISQYLARYVDDHQTLVTGRSILTEYFINEFFTRYLRALFKLGETEYEDTNDPFPRGRIPFLTIHQAKGLEFPVVVLGNITPAKGPQRVEVLVRPLLEGDYEPLDRSGEFDTMRKYYVALSRAKNLLVIANMRGPGIRRHGHLDTLLNNVPSIDDLDLDDIPAEETLDSEVPRVYSYTADYLSYLDCPRKYMLFRKYGFAPARTTIMFFGSLVHRTIEDLHHLMIERRGEGS